MHGGPIYPKPCQALLTHAVAVGTQCSAFPSHAVTDKPFITLSPLRSCFAVYVELSAPSPAAGTKPAGGAKPAAGLFLRSDISGNDINCNQKDYDGKVLNYCQVCGGIKQLSDACK
jgi:hypothetical protein